MYRTVRFERHLSGGSCPVKRILERRTKIDALLRSVNGSGGSRGLCVRSVSDGAWDLPPSALPGISPTGGEIDMRLSFAHRNGRE